MAGQAGYTPEEIAAFRAKVGTGGPGGLLPKGVTNFDKKASDVSASLSRLAKNPPAYFDAGAGINPLGPVLKQAGGDAAAAMNGPVGPGLGQATRAAVDDKASAPIVLRPMEQPDVAPQAAPSLREQLLSKLQGTGAGSGGGSGLGTLKEAFMTARGKQLGDYDQDKYLAGQKGFEQASRIADVAELEKINAAQMQRDAEIQQQADESAHQNAQQMISRNMELADDIGRQQIDPKRLVNNMSTGQKIDHVLGSALGGFVAGFKGGPNEFLQRYDNEVAQDIQSQINQQDNKKASLGARQSIFGQMLAETGDRRLAAIQTRNLYYEAAKQKLAAQAEQLGIPEVKTAAEQNIAALQHQQDAMNAQFKGEAYQSAAQQAAAAAAAQRAAEAQAWQRQKDVFEMGLKKDQLDIEKMKASGMTPEDIQKQVQALGAALAKPELADGRAAVENSKQRLANAKPDEGLPGINRWADFRSAVVGDRYGLTDEERKSRADWDKTKLAYRKQITGSGGSAEEMKAIEKAFEGARTPAEQRQAIEEADALFKQVEARTKAGYDPRAVQQYNQNLAAQAGIRPKDGNVSDERAKQFARKLKGY